MATFLYTQIGIGTNPNDNTGTPARTAASASINPAFLTIFNAFDIDATGRLNSSVLFENNFGIEGRNSANTNNFRMIKFNLQDKIELGEAGTELLILADSILSNDLALLGRNNADSASFRLIKFNTSDVVEISETGKNVLIVGKTNISPVNSTDTLLVGTSGASGGVGAGQIVSHYDGGLTNGFYSRDTRVAAGTDVLLSIDRAGVDVGRITTTLAATAYVTSSDERLKSEFRAISDMRVMGGLPDTPALIMICQAVESKGLGEFDWLSGAGDNVWGYNAQWLIKNQPGFGGVEGNGPMDAKLGSVYGTRKHLAVIGDIKHDAKYDKNDKLTKKSWIEKNAVIKEAWVEDLKVSACGADASQRVPLLEAAIYELLARVEELEAINNGS